MASAAELACALEHLCRQAEAQWGLRVELREGPQRMIPRAVADHVYRIIQEAVANAGKHARAAHASVRLRLGVDALTVTVADDGVGFPFRGQYDLQTLRERGIGPRSLRERVASLRGQMTLTSTMSGSTVEIVLPLTTRPSGPLG
jgi:two-component system NarL family sensor kinase